VPHILIGSDAPWIVDEVRAALGGPDTTFVVCTSGKQVLPTVSEQPPDLAVLDLQIGTMGGMAVVMALRLEESGERLPYVATLMLLDRRADLFLAQRAGSDGWLVKPLDSIRLRKAARTVLDGGTYFEGLPEEPVVAAADGGDSATG
jgi:DNA-binding response OmpR family regulator